MCERNEGNGMTGAETEQRGAGRAGGRKRRTQEDRAYMLALGNRIRLMRTVRKRSGASVARDLGMTASWLCRVESGEVMPGAHSVQRIARALNVSPGWLLCGDRKP
ncbi:MAG TPA: helix-turn-helix transcriptional regulator, partial [Bryobacteraceae bacterium]